jgi:hypothetical protein
MSVKLAKDEMFSSAVAGLPKVIDLIAACPFEDRTRAFEAAEQSYLKTARGLGYEEADAQQWAEAVIHQLRQRFVEKMICLRSPATENPEIHQPNNSENQLN